MLTQDAEAVLQWVAAKQGLQHVPADGVRGVGSVRFDGSIAAGLVWYRMDGDVWVHAAVEWPSIEFFDAARGTLLAAGETECLFTCPPDNAPLRRLAARVGARVLPPEDHRCSGSQWDVYLLRLKG